MTVDRENMQKAIKHFIVPQIRALGFKGSLPHFRRRVGTEHQMLMIFFNKYGGSFYIEAGRITDVRLNELRQHWRSAEALRDSVLTVGHCYPSSCARLGPEGFVLGQDHWFVFGQNNLASTPHQAQPESVFNKVALQAASWLREHTDAFLPGAP